MLASYSTSRSSRPGYSTLPLPAAGFGQIRIAKPVAATPYCFDKVIAARCLGQLLAQLANKDVDDFDLGLVHSAVEMVEKHFLCQRRALAQSEQFEDPVFLAGEVHGVIVDRDLSGVEIDDQLAGPHHRFTVALGAAGDCLNARDHLPVIKKVAEHITVTKAETFDPVVELGEAQEDQDRCPDMCVAAQPPQHIVTIRIARTQIQQNDIVIEAADLQTVQTEIRRVAQISP